MAPPSSYDDDDDGVDASSLRLNPSLVPHHYELCYNRLDVDGIDNDRPPPPSRPHVRRASTSASYFAGTVTIHCVGTRRSNVVSLHCLDLTIVSATLIEVAVEGEDGTAEEAELCPLQAVEYRYKKRWQTCSIVFDPAPPPDYSSPSSPSLPSSDAAARAIRPGASYNLVVAFEGQLNDNMHGLYRSTYFDPTSSGVMRCIVATQFEPTEARRAFPCFDEPKWKATFQLTVTLRCGGGGPSTCLSNTPIEDVCTTYDDDGGRKRSYVFAVTPKMSTYLVALIVGDFDVLSATSHRTKIRTSVYAVPGKARHGRFCLEVASDAIDLFAELFDVPYPLDKSDLVALPDFSGGAMENWGCVTYREAKILVKENSTSETMKRGIARTVCHELAHMWFGNLVTMDFWTQLWLKEGVARYLEFVAVNRLFPEWEMWTEFQSVFCLALSLDSMRSSHPVEVLVNHPDEIFDAISYAKGASLVRMVSSHIGFDAFLEGMKLYLRRYAYGNATTKMLWQALEEASGVPVVEMMTPWTSQTGFPLVLLSEDNDGTIETPRFLATGPDGCDNDGSETPKWPIPVTAIVEGESGVQGPWLLNGPAGEARLLEQIRSWSQDGKWFKLNASQSGFYRVAYTSTQWSRLAKAMSPVGPFSATDRLGLISDSFAIGRAGYASIVDSLRFVEGFAEHDKAEYAVWEQLSDNLANLASLYRSEPFFPKYQAFLRRVYSKQLTLLGWDACKGEAQRVGTLRSTVIGMLSTAGDPKVHSEALRRFRMYSENPDEFPIPGDLRQIIFKAALRQDEEFVFNELRRIYEASSFPEEKRNCICVMGCVKDVSRHAQMIEYVLFSGNVKLQDIAFPLNPLSLTTDDGGKACWRLMRDRYDELASKFRGGPMWGPCVGLLCRGLTTIEEADEVEAFFRDPRHPCGSGERRLSQALEAVRTKATRLIRDRAAVAQYLDEVVRL